MVASSIGADLAMDFLTTTHLPVEHVFFDGGQFAQIGKGTRRIMVPFLYLAIKSLYWSKGGTLKKIMWCDDDAIKPYFIAAGKALTYGSMRRQMADSLEDKPFPALPEDLQCRCWFEFGSGGGPPETPCRKRGSFRCTAARGVQGCIRTCSGTRPKQGLTSTIKSLYWI